MAGKALRGVLSIKRLLQEKDTSLNINHLTDSCLFHVKPDDERAQVVAELAEREVDLVAVVERGELVGCLMEKEIAHLQEDDVTEDVQLQGATLPLEKPYLEISPWTLWKNVRSGSCCCLSQKLIPAACFSILKRRWNLQLPRPFYSAINWYWRQQRYADYFDAGTFNGAGRSAAARYGPGDPQRSFNFAADRSDAGHGRVLARVDDGHRYGNHADRRLTLVCITLWSAVVSSVIPMVLKRIGIDPAVVSAPFIATLIDGTGLIIYFKIAQHFLGLN